MIPVSSRMRASTRAAIALIVGVPLLGFASTQAREHPRADPDPLPTHAVFLPLVAKHPLAAPILLTPPDGYVAPDGSANLSWSPSPGAGLHFLHAERPGAVVDLGTLGPVSFTDPGTWSWTVRARGTTTNYYSPWAPAWTFTIPVQAISDDPAITSPPSGTVLHTGRPTVTWSQTRHNDIVYPYTDTYHIQVDDNPAFDSPEYEESGFTGSTRKLMQLAYTTSRGFPFYSLLPYAAYHVRIRSFSLDGEISAWSATSQFDVSAPYDDCKSNGTGPKTFSISGGSSDPDAPHMYRVDISEIDPGVGGSQTLTIYATVNSPGTTSIDAVDVALVTDSGEAAPLAFSLSSGTALNGQWTGGWTMPGSYCYNYGFELHLANAIGEDSAVLIARNN